jgi:hypothetical protein
MTVESLTAFVSSVLVIFGALPPIISLVWGIHAHTDDAKLAVVEAMPDVKAIVAVANPNPEGAVIAAAENPKRRKVVET